MSTNRNILGDGVILRGVEPEDIELMYGIENDIDTWGVSGTTQPFSRYMLERFVESQRLDIYESRSLRLMATDLEGGVVGIVDLFEFDPYNHRAGVGIYVIEPYRRCGYGRRILDTLHRYCRDRLQLHQLWCDIGADNEASLALFEGAGYDVIGVKRDWRWFDGEYHSDVTLQVIL